MFFLLCFQQFECSRTNVRLRAKLERDNLYCSLHSVYIEKGDKNAENQSPIWAPMCWVGVSYSWFDSIITIHVTVIRYCADHDRSCRISTTDGHSSLLISPSQPPVPPFSPTKSRTSQDCLSVCVTGDRLKEMRRFQSSLRNLSSLREAKLRMRNAVHSRCDVQYILTVWPLPPWHLFIAYGIKWRTQWFTITTNDEPNLFLVYISPSLIFDRSKVKCRNVNWVLKACHGDKAWGSTLCESLI